jgi:hypothetical protein
VKIFRVTVIIASIQAFLSIVLVSQILMAQEIKTYGVFNIDEVAKKVYRGRRLTLYKMYTFY